MAAALHDKRILITGATAGIGRGIAHSRVDAGASIIILSDGFAAITGVEITADHGASALLVRSEDLK